MSRLNDFRCIRIFPISWFLTSQSRLHNECSECDDGGNISASREPQSKHRAAKEMGTPGHGQDTLHRQHQDKVKQGQASLLFCGISNTCVKGSDRHGPEVDTKKGPEVTRDTGRPHRWPLLQLRPRPTRPPLLLPFR